MRFLSKISFILLISCSSIDYGYLTLFKEINASNRIEDISTFKDGDYSFIRASQGKNQAIMILSEYRSGIETWVGADNERLITYNGLIIATSGLNQNFIIHNFESIKNLQLRNDFNAYVSFSNPDAKFINAKFSLIKNSSQNCKNQYNYNINFFDIARNDIVIICLDDRNRPIHSSQLINPLGKRINIEYFYKYKKRRD